MIPLIATKPYQSVQRVPVRWDTHGGLTCPGSGGDWWKRQDQSPNSLSTDLWVGRTFLSWRSSCCRAMLEYQKPVLWGSFMPLSQCPLLSLSENGCDAILTSEIGQKLGVLGKVP